MTFEDVFQVVRVSAAAMTKRLSVDQIKSSQKLSEVDITDDIAITELKTRTFKALDGTETGKLAFGKFFNLMDVSTSSTVGQAAQAGLQAYQGAFTEAG